jgi:hypothetical protein
VTIVTKMQNDDHKTEKEAVLRKRYEPPALVAVSLRPEEAVLGTCKNTAFAGPVSSTCAAVHCRVLGS